VLVLALARVNGRQRVSASQRMTAFFAVAVVGSDDSTLAAYIFQVKQFIFFGK
jgi:hypothetical protein